MLLVLKGSAYGTGVALEHDSHLTAGLSAATLEYCFQRTQRT
jgi:hypothetical protein